MHPNHGAGQMGYLPPCGADAFNDHNRGVRRHVNLASASAARPRRWLVMHPLSTVQGFEDAVDHQVVPAEPRVPPGDVVGVDNGEPTSFGGKPPARMLLRCSLRRSDSKTPRVRAWLAICRPTA